MKIGVLALQGDFALHAQALVRAGAEAVEVRKPAELDAVGGLIIPGGESTTLLHLMR
ncbi:MAG: pyridoxal 5'-phosphate synthase glutaminase subunit PdxT, partial [Candidatus Rokuibacteriota bacterium]